MDKEYSSLADWLPGFFQQWPGTPRISDTACPDATQLSVFLDNLTVPLQTANHRSLDFNPWDVVGLGRKEVLNTTILAWLLNPWGTHGFGREPLTTLLQQIAVENGNTFPVDFSANCQVQTETYPTGNQQNRVDVEIDADDFFLLIEVKIDAAEQKEQIDRYCGEARTRAGKRPWRVIFLTPGGGESLTCSSDNAPSVICMSWRQLALAWEEVMMPHYQRQFSTDTGSFMKQMAVYSAFCFIEKMKLF